MIQVCKTAEENTHLSSGEAIQNVVEFLWQMLYYLPLEPFFIILSPFLKKRIYTSLQRMLEKWADKSLVKFNKKCTVLHLGRHNPMHQYMLAAAQLESSFTGKDRGGGEGAVPVDTELTTARNAPLWQEKSQQHPGLH